MPTASRTHWISSLQTFAFSGGEQLAAVGVNPRLAAGLSEGGTDFLLKQRRKHEQRIKRDPRQRGGLIGGAAERGVQLRLLGGFELPGEQPVFQPLEFVFEIGPERHGGHRPERKARFGGEFGRHPVLVGIHRSGLSGVAGQNTKPATALAVAGF